ncbi:site-specific DNA-methyltransferase [Lactiplantibacillus plantarum]|uniref:DNA-methyltransferase n=1 Tax=Lactiplantibacillus plantarum TaxID=1590 RepID=UPI000BEAB8D2|nr:site-specific DNA-methyltransferase [Lactiplantibacillus plantarum]MCT4440760.1 site-specific DNA-methyltransferase [Lactiplantibacillus plantarum]MDP4437820.1 site-specific DNA-methyltransferase [Lactiplantibacillus plantarum]MDP4440950.1 site-specific DNA-methyltransferase [Lactiplantibacillus plantarum]MDP4459546.1 site-specific DNA-methyltransferase [Lactiplantibacillus plantarum]
MPNVNLLKGDCLELMKNIPDRSIDMVLCDLPYGTTANKWDIVIPFDKLWEQYRRIIKNNSAIALFGQEPFSSRLRLSNDKMYRYDFVWEKSRATGFYNANKMPLRCKENITIFYKHLPTYNPQKTKGAPYYHKATKNRSGSIYISNSKSTDTQNDGDRYPRDVIKFNNVISSLLHPTQKPVPLLEYLIKTYTCEGETVLDNCMGSGSTGVAAINLGRSFIGYEIDDDYFRIAEQRISEARRNVELF